MSFIDEYIFCNFIYFLCDDGVSHAVIFLKGNLVGCVFANTSLGIAP